MTVSDNFLSALPKAELHVHIEGTLEPEMCFALAYRNGIALPYDSVEELRSAYQFSNLQDFLDIYYQGANVLIKEQDFFDLTWAYLERAHQDTVLHSELFFDPQTHTARGISFDVVVSGISRAMIAAEKKYGITSKLIFCILRHEEIGSGLRTLKLASEYKDKIVGIGLDSSENGFPPNLFGGIFAKARAEGFLPVAHAGEEGPPDYVWEALNILQVVRIDHGNRSLEDAELVARLVKEKMCLTVCPLSNLKLKVVERMANHPLRKMLDYGLMATVNSDDPAYFGGYINDNFRAVSKALDLTKGHLVTLAKNSFLGSFLEAEEKEKFLHQVDEFSGSES